MDENRTLDPEQGTPVATAEIEVEAAPTQEQMDELMAKLDKESAYRRFDGPMKWILSALLIGFSLFQLYVTFLGTIPTQQLRAIHLGTVLFFAYILYPMGKNMSRKKLPWYDVILAFCSAASLYYWVVNFRGLMQRSGNYNQTDFIVGGLAIIFLLIACYRVVGIPITAIASVFFLYAIFGNYFPGFLNHKGFTLQRTISHLIYTTEGVIGSPIGVSSTFIFLFILFGAFLDKTGIGQFFIDLANGLAGSRAGGPAKVAVLSSALMGTVSGSSVSNTVTTGSLTIPMMKKLGYSPEFSAAVEASASTGGQIMPPIMGAAAFIMSETIGVPYLEVAKAAIIPALLYFTGIWVMVHLEAKKLGLKGMPRDQLPNVAKVVKERFVLVIPLLGIIMLLVIGRTPSIAALYGILLALAAYMGTLVADNSKAPAMRVVVPVVLAAVLLALVYGKGSIPTAVTLLVLALVALCLLALLVSFATKKTMVGMGQLAVEVGRSCLEALESGARNIIGVAIACGAAGIIIGVVTLTGLGLKMANGLVAIAAGVAGGIANPDIAMLVQLLLTLFFTMISSIILGMGAPTTANYIITSTICAPAIVNAANLNPNYAVPLLAAHMFTFYFGIVADITPPVALAAYAGSAIAKGNAFKTGVTATKLAIAAFIIPYIFIFSPQILMIDTTVMEVVQIVITSLIGMVGVGTAMQGFMLTRMSVIERVIALPAGLLLIFPTLATDIIGVCLIGGIFVFQLLKSKRAAAAV